MHKKFDNVAIEKKWQTQWEADGIYNVGFRDKNKEKEYVLVEWPYPSGNLHIGHWYAFAVPDIYVRFNRMTGKQVLYPMGFDAFGLPAENAAIKRNLDPKAWTNDNIAYMRNQLSSMGNSFSWDKTCNSTDPEYYKWTQSMFTKFFETGVAYRGKGTVNWCPGCNTVVANEQVHPDGTCDRSGDIIEKREMPQWMLGITKYADRLIDDLDALDWPEHIKEAQRQWIGRSRGAELDFKINIVDEKADGVNSTVNRTNSVSVFTTRPDTLYGVTYLVLAPEHALVAQNEASIANWSEVASYIALSKQKAEQDRLDNTKEKTGVKLEGITATNPVNDEEIPVYISDYVLASYGTGAIMAVPAHDERDNAFAKKFGLTIQEVIEPTFIKRGGPDAFRDDEPIAEREAITAIVRNPKNNTYLGLRWKDVDWDTFITGGIEDGQTPEEAARAEIREETGYKNLKLVSVLPRFHAKFWHVPKSVNRFAHFHCFVFEVEDEERDEINTEEKAKHDCLWLTAEELVKFRLPDGHRHLINIVLDAASIYTETGLLKNSAEFNGMDGEEAKEAIVEKVGGRMTSTYRLRDWSIGRQRYWGVPIPIVYDREGKAHSVPEEHLPWLLPEDVDFRPTGVAPLAKSEGLQKRTVEIFGEGWTPEVETMDTFVDSSWYFLRYLDNHNDEGPTSVQKQKDWMPIDIYFGGAEHTTMHLLYSRFWQKALLDLGLVTENEPYKRRINRGLILGPDGNKMSKSKGNVIDPDDHVKMVGADTVKMYLAFMGPYEGSNYPFDLGGIAGIRRFLERVYGLTDHLSEEEPKEITVLLHKTIAKVREDIQSFKFNTAISAMMIFVNKAEKTGITSNSYQSFMKVIAPFAPYLAEEIWSDLGHEKSVHLSEFPEANSTLLTDETVTVGVQINGKLRGTVVVSPEATEAEIMKLTMENKDITRYTTGLNIKKIIYIPGRILNILVGE